MLCTAISCSASIGRDSIGVSAPLSADKLPLTGRRFWTGGSFWTWGFGPSPPWYLCELKLFYCNCGTGFIIISPIFLKLIN